MFLNLMKISRKLYDESDEGLLLDVDVQYPENLRNFHNDLPFLLEKMKIEKSEKKFKKLKRSIKPRSSFE